MNRLLNEDLTAIRERAEKATEGPWRVGATVSGYLEIQSKKTEFPTQDTMDFIAHSREDIPKLLAEIERLREQLRLIWSDTFYENEEYVSVKHVIRKRAEKALGGVDE